MKTQKFVPHKNFPLYSIILINDVHRLYIIILINDVHRQCDSNTNNIILHFETR